jgi:two-component system sensor histidine kinase KdpD
LGYDRAAMPAIDQLYREPAMTVRIERTLYAIAFVAGMTMLLAIAQSFFDIRHVSIAYVIPVLVAAIRWGVIEAVIAALAAVAAAAFFFYEPIFDLRVDDTFQIVDLVLFLCVAVITGHFATRLRAEAERANRRERENGALYAFARRLAAAKDASDIYNAIQQHLALLVGRSVMLFGPGTTESEAAERCAQAHAPLTVQDAIVAALRSRSEKPRKVIEEATSGAWLIRAVSPQSPDFGVIAINLGPRDRLRADTMLADIEAALTDTAATLNRLGLGRAISEVRSRSEAERLRDALLGSVSHELRTPLASVLGAATTLAGSPVIRSDARLSSLATVVREEAERLNHDIQNLLDATRISSDGVRPNFEWSEVADIVNAAIERRRGRLKARKLQVRLAPDLPLVYVDSVLIEQALGQVLDNAIKYSPPSSSIIVEGRRTHDDVTISVTDQGAGFSDAERERAGERFFRGDRHASAIAGAGLGLWIARSFVSVNAGHLDIQSQGAGAGSRVSIHLPVARESEEHQTASAWSASEA